MIQLVYKTIIASVSRCGQHAFCNWLCKQYDHDVVFENIVSSFSASKKKRANTTDYILYSPKNDTTRNVSKDHACKHLVQLHENCHHDDLANKILFLRDPFNWIASLLGSMRRVDEQLWINSYIALQKHKHQARYYFKYNSWMSSKDYRQQCCESLGLPFTDQGRNDVPRFGNGSTFSHMQYDGKGSEMETLTRYKKVLNNEVPSIGGQEYKNIFKQNPALVEIAISDFDMEDIYDSYIR